MMTRWWPFKWRKVSFACSISNSVSVLYFLENKFSAIFFFLEREIIFVCLIDQSNFYILFCLLFCFVFFHAYITVSRSIENHSWLSGKQKTGWSKGFAQTAWFVCKAMPNSWVASEIFTRSQRTWLIRLLAWLNKKYINSF